MKLAKQLLGNESFLNDTKKSKMKFEEKLQELQDENMGFFYRADYAIQQIFDKKRKAFTETDQNLPDFMSNYSKGYHHKNNHKKMNKKSANLGFIDYLRKSKQTDKLYTLVNKIAESQSKRALH